MESLNYLHITKRFSLKNWKSLLLEVETLLVHAIIPTSIATIPVSATQTKH